MEIRETKEQKTLAIRMFTPAEKLSDAIGSSYGQIGRYMEAHQVHPAGPPFAMYYNMDMSNLDVEIGIPVQGEIDGQDNIKACSIPGGPAATAVHTGPYDTIGTTYDKITAFVKEKNLETQPYCYEFYLNDPRETKPEELKTEIFFPLKD
jgi:effector-binding domain-containing protein